MRLFAWRRWLLLLASVAVVSAPSVSYAQFGGLANMAKGKALEALNNTVMKELEKKFTSMVAKEPISEEAKAKMVKTLTDMARPIVKKFIDAAGSGKLPNPAELVQTVLKEVLPRVPELLAAAKASGGVQAGAPPPPAAAQAAAPDQQAAPVPTARGAQAMFEQLDRHTQYMRDRPRIAAFVSGAKDSAVDRVMAVRLVAALVKSGGYQAAEDYSEFIYRAAEEQRGGAALSDPEQVRKLGRQYGARYVCVAEIVSIMGEDKVFASIRDVETGKITAKGSVDAALRAPGDLTAASGRIVEALFKKELPAAPPPPPPPAQQAYEPPAPCPEPTGTAGGEEERERKSKTGFTFGYGFSGNATVFQVGSVHTRPMSSDAVSLVVEANVMFGSGTVNTSGLYTGYGDDFTFSFSGVNIPVICKLEKSVFFTEAGVFADILSGEDKYSSKEAWLVNVGVVLGGGLEFSKGYTQYFYKFNYGTAYYSHTIGIRQLF